MANDFQALTFRGIPIVFSEHAHRDRMYFVNPKEWRVADPNFDWQRVWFGQEEPGVHMVLGPEKGEDKDMIRLDTPSKPKPLNVTDWGTATTTSTIPYTFTIKYTTNATGTGGLNW